MEEIKLYHGTTSVYLDSILEKGLLPREETGNSNYEVQYVWGASDIFESYPDRVYLTNNPDRAKMLGEEAVDVNEGEVIVLEVLVSQENLLPDEDSKKQTWQESLEYMGSVAYKGIITPDKIKVYNITPGMISLYRSIKPIWKNAL